ncbi:MAG: 16S rRNA (cytosine(1402)-N(4))-methyltransferase [Rhodospirillaceae bacterium]|nr:16S rRNA (cytosine(1402)-N(4))-methyltransferase [Rhodospirillaceae bacterium]|tara:strand:+ start:1331 stop:2296 length:966 start_codon:yes stop_codon:yes gene_type:complete
MSALQTDNGHVPVLLDRVIATLAPRDGETMVDATFGGGGYSAGLLDAADCCVLAIDRDPDAIERGRALSVRHGGRLSVLEGRFSSLDRVLDRHVDDGVDGVVFDLGVSSFQLDQAERGFSFRHDGPLDMRMGRQGKSAADAVNSLDEAELARLIGHLGEERRARAVARAIVAARREAPIDRTAQLADIVRGAVRRSPDSIDPATRTFQALRLWVNDELGELELGLDAAEAVLREGGRLVVVAFHSLEDRIVKRFLAERSGQTARPSRHAPPVFDARRPTFELLERKAVKPTDLEVAENARARSARLRAAVRTDAPAWRDAA